MIKLRNPIETRQKNILNKGYERFANKLMANYEYMAMTMAPEELLHMVSTPPEVYLIEDGHGAGKNTNNTWNSNETRLTLVNNMINRLMINPTSEMSYQDRVFIESILRKIGINDTKTFISQVRNLQNRISEDTELVKYYISQGDEFRTFLQNTRAEREEAAAKKQDTYTEPTERLFLHDSVYDRLQTTEIVEALQELYTDHSAAGNQINYYESSITEQGRLSMSERLRETERLLYGETRNTERIYLNPYEVGAEVEEGSEIRTQVVRELTSAVLLEAIANLYQMRQEEIKENQDNWYDYSSYMGSALENVVNRYENFHNSESSFMYMNIAPEEPAEVIGEAVKREEIPVPMEHHMTIQDMVAYYDEHNAELMQQVQNINRTVQAAPEIRVDRERARADALRALEHPEEVRREYEEHRTELEHVRQTRETEYEKLMTEETRQVFDILKAMRNGEALPEGVAVHHNAEMLLNAQAEELRRTGEQVAVSEITKEIFRQNVNRTETDEVNSEEMIHRRENRTGITEERNSFDSSVEISSKMEQNRIISDLVNNISETRNETRNLTASDEIAENLVHHTDISRNISETVSQAIHENVSEVLDRQHTAFAAVREPETRTIDQTSADIVFRREQRTLTEETLNEVLNNRTDLNRRDENTEHTEIINNYETVNKETETDVTETTTENVSRIIQTQMRQEMASISDQVYRQIEQRLSLERSRRGY